MTTVKESVSLNASATDIWSVIGDFDRLDTWHPAVAGSEAASSGGSSIRHLILGDGSKIVERLDESDDKARSYTYTILDAGPLPVRNYQSTLEVSGDTSVSIVTWSSEFEPHATPEADAQAAISGVYKAGFAALIDKFGAA
jgi:hypothetical protein